MPVAPTATAMTPPADRFRLFVLTLAATLPAQEPFGSTRREGAWLTPGNPAAVGAELDLQAIIIDPRRPATLGNAVQEFLR